MEIQTIHPAALAVIERYKNLQLGGKSVAAPYHINDTLAAKDLRVMVGKGTPEEIELEVKTWAQLKGLDLHQMTESEIRDFMRSRKIGIDCSGFVYHVVSAWLQAERQPSLRHFIKFSKSSLLHKLKLLLRPAENIGAEALTGPLNTQPIKLQDILPGDLIRSRSSQHPNVQHLLLVTSVTRDNSKVTSFEYHQSTWYYGKANGVRSGTVEITDINAELKDQNWSDLDENGINHTLNGLLTNYEDNGLRRPAYMSVFTNGHK